MHCTSVYQDNLLQCRRLWSNGKWQTNVWLEANKLCFVNLVCVQSQYSRDFKAWGRCVFGSVFAGGHQRRFKRELERMGFDSHSAWRISTINSNYRWNSRNTHTSSHQQPEQRHHEPCVCIPQALCQLPRANNRACCRHRPGAGEGGGVQIMEEDPGRRLQVFLSLIKDCSVNKFSKHINDMLKDITKGLHNYP